MVRRLGGAEPGVTALLAGGTLELSLLEEEATLDAPVIVTAWVGAFLLYIVLLVYAVAVMRSVLEEKTSRVVEIVISSIRPWQLMLGKILGVGAVGLTQLAVWSLAVALIFALALPSLTAARPELAQLAELGRFAPGAGYLALFGVFFLFGYFIYAALYAAVGAMCNSDEEAQQAQLPLMFLVVAPILLLMPVLERPNGVAAVVLSLVPFFSPVLMFARAAGGVAPAWQVALSFLLMALTVLGVAWVAGRIYRAGILMAGKRPTLAELLRWVREA
jgi:ABC-2 type transport system permease protein